MPLRRYGKALRTITMSAEHNVDVDWKYTVPNLFSAQNITTVSLRKKNQPFQPQSTQREQGNSMPFIVQHG